MVKINYKSNVWLIRYWDLKLEHLLILKSVRAKLAGPRDLHAFRTRSWVRVGVLVA